MAARSAFTDIDIHNYQGMLEAYLEKLSLSSSICPANREVLQKYHHFIVNEGLCVPTMNKHLQIMINIGESLHERHFCRIFE